MKAVPAFMAPSPYDQGFRFKFLQILTKEIQSLAVTRKTTRNFSISYSPTSFYMKNPIF